MAKKVVAEGGKRREIIAAALELFLEKGYEGTSIRMIQKKVGSEVGLFYYYFKNKDEVFQEAIALFAESYKKDLEEIMQRGKRDPFRFMTGFFEYMVREAIKFRKKYMEKLHWTVQWAIREYALVVIEPHILQIIETLMQFGAKPKLKPSVAATYMAYGVGSSILHLNEKLFMDQRDEIMKGAHLIMGLEPETSDLMFPNLAGEDEIKEMKKFMLSVGEDFPQTAIDEWIKSLENKVEKKEIIVTKLQNQIVGMITFSRERCEIEFSGIGKEFHHRGIEERNLITVMSELPVGEQLIATVYYKDGKYPETESLYRKFGFEELKNGETMKYYTNCRQFTFTIPKEAPKPKIQ